MTQHSELEPDAEERLRKALGAAAPRSSSTHDEAILGAARARAQATASKNNRPEMPRNRRLPAWSLAATFVLAVAIVWLLRIETPDESYLRSDTAANVTPADGAVLSTMPTRFSWPASDLTQRYQLNVYDDAAKLVWTSPRITATEWQTGEELDLPANARYFWVVDLLDSAQRPTIGPFWFTLE